MFQEDKQHKLGQYRKQYSTNKPPQLLPVSPSIGSTIFAVIQMLEKINYMSAWLLCLNKINTLPLGVALKLRWRLAKLERDGQQWD